MANSGHDTASRAQDDILPLDDAIARMESGEADEDIRIDFGGGVVGDVLEGGGLEALLQRARGLRLIRMMAERKTVERPSHMRRGKTALHPAVEEILDALRTAG